MTITFSESEKSFIGHRLEEIGLSASNKDIEDILSSIEAAYTQQFTDEADHLIGELS